MPPSFPALSSWVNPFSQKYMAHRVHAKSIQQAHTSPAKRASLQRSLPSAASFSVQRVLQLQRTTGNQAVQRLLGTLKQPAPVGPEGGDVPSDVQAELDRARGGGQPLDPVAGAQMGRAMGANFSTVRVHTDARAQAINRSLGAQAATVGRNIFFSKNAYSPGTAQGRRLLAHELTHVVQQRAYAGNTVRPRLKVGPANDAHEREAGKASAGVAFQPARSTGRPTVQRLMSYEDFKNKVEKKYSPDKNNKKKVGITGEKSFVTALHEAYKNHEAEPDNLGNLARLHHAITAWQTFNFQEINAGKEERKDTAVANALAMNRILKPLLKAVKAEFKKKSAKQTAKQGGYVETLDEMLGEGGDQMTFESLAQVDMPKEFVKVGISPTYYEKNLKAGGAALILKFAYSSLERGDLEKAVHELNHPTLLALPGYPLIRSLLLSHFSKSTKLKDMLSIKPTKGDLTDEEMDALSDYTGDSDAANSSLRGAANLQDASTNAALAYKHLVSAMSKLPRFKGVAYRGFTPFSGVDKAYQVGATVADLAFTSAAASFAGVAYYLSNGALNGARGTQNYFSVIRSKTAVHISHKSDLKSENEVLFRPGTRFKVKAVWRHSADGKVPMNAPTEAQMILQRVGQHTAVYGGKGYGKQDWDALRAKKKGGTQPEDIGAFQGQAQVKVFEMAEQ
jgi:hypothetical protein